MSAVSLLPAVYYDHSRDLKSYTDLLELKEEGGYIITVNFGGIKVSTKQPKPYTSTSGMS